LPPERLCHLPDPAVRKTSLVIPRHSRAGGNPVRLWLCRSLCVVALLFALPLGADTLPKSIQLALAQARIPESAIAVVVEPVEGNGAQFSHNGNVAMNPASVMKLLTAHAALELLGPAASWRTGFWAEIEPDEDGQLRGNLYLKGNGDPALTVEKFWRLLRQLRARGVKTITGDLMLDRSAFIVPAGNPGAFDKRPLRAYNTLPDALLVDAFALSFSLRPEEEKARFLVDIPNDNIAIDAKMTLGQGGCDGWRERLTIRQTPGRLEIAGEFPKSCGERSLLLAPLKPDAYLDGLFRALWRELGGSLKGKTRSGTTPPDSILLAAQNSPPLADIVRDMNKWSNNVSARQIFLALGEGTAKSEAASAKRVANWLSDVGLDFPELVLENGSGLSRLERISARHMNQILVRAWRGANMPDFLASLPIAGVDGTMQKRLTGTVAMGRARFKTGLLDHVKTAAGYVQDVRGRRYAMTIFINHPNAGSGQGVMDALIRQVAEGSFPEQGTDKTGN
jgi:D-alanyl-D-alanine carboxypeptidase/D-alanyl-D-alanine-endopeptidase (penicillin-binding protein 4)